MELKKNEVLPGIQATRSRLVIVTNWGHLHKYPHLPRWNNIPYVLYWTTARNRTQREGTQVLIVPEGSSDFGSLSSMHSTMLPRWELAMRDHMYDCWGFVPVPDVSLVFHHDAANPDDTTTFKPVRDADGAPFRVDIFAGKFARDYSERLTKALESLGFDTSAFERVDRVGLTWDKLRGPFEEILVLDHTNNGSPRGFTIEPVRTSV